MVETRDVESAIKAMDAYLSSLLTPEALEAKKRSLQCVSAEEFPRVQQMSTSARFVGPIKKTLLGVLASMYSQLEPPLVARLSSRRASLAAANYRSGPNEQDGGCEEEEEESFRAPLDFYTQAPAAATQAESLFTQPSDAAVSEVGPVLLPSTQSGADFFATSPALLPATSSGVPAMAIEEEEEEPMRSELIEPTQALDTQVMPTHVIPPPLKEMIRTMSQELITNLVKGKGCGQVKDEQESLDESEDKDEQESMGDKNEMDGNARDQHVIQNEQDVKSDVEQVEEVRVVSVDVMKDIIRVCNEDPLRLFQEEDPVIDEAYKHLAKYQKSQAEDRELPPMSQLLPRDLTPIAGPKKKTICYDSELVFDSSPLVQGKKKSMLLPDETASRVTWTPEKENMKTATKELTFVNPNNSHNSNNSPAPSQPESQRKRARLYEAEAQDPEGTGPVRLDSPGRGRRKWTRQETEDLKDGLRRFGRKWAVILANYKFLDRSSVDLKDKARNLAKAGHITLPSKSKQ